MQMYVQKQHMHGKVLGIVHDMWYDIVHDIVHGIVMAVCLHHTQLAVCLATVPVVSRCSPLFQSVFSM